jgi:hypothetical protein
MLRTKWFYRSIPLALGGEVWDDLSDHPAWDWLLRWAQEHDRDTDASRLTYYLTRTLVLEVIHAAGAIEYTVERIEVCLDDAQAWVDEHVAPVESTQPEPEFGMGVGHPDIEHARIEMANLLGWMHALLDRLERPPKRGERRLGLIPSIAADYPLRHRLEELHRELAAALEERQLRNFTIHSSTIPHANAGARLLDGERIVFSIPDRPESPVYLFDQFTWENGRELRSFARSVLSAVEVFMEGFVSALEENREQQLARRGT